MMRFQISKRSISFFLAGIVFLAMLSGCGSISGQNTIASKPVAATPNTTNNAIARENALPGTAAWKISPRNVDVNEIQAYAGSTSVAPGQAITFYESTSRPGFTYSINFYRLGWYHGLGGRLMTSVSGLTGHGQGYYDLFQKRLVDCTLCNVDPKTGLIEANWVPSYILTVPSNWVSGVYLAKFIDVRGVETYAPFVVRSSTPSAFLAVTPDTTDQAYNSWGGYSLYENDEPQDSPGFQFGNRVSFDRPYVQGLGSGHLLLFDMDAIRWMERQGYDLSYISDVDLHQDPGQLLQHKVYLSLGHDEYWTKEMRAGVEQARDHGVSLAFLGSNAIYWQIRFEGDSAGTSNRTIVCYKVLTSSHDLNRDPLYGKDNSRLTTQWRDPALGRPENALVGIMFSDLIHKQLGYPWKVDHAAPSSLLSGTGLTKGKSYGCGLVGYEWDRIFSNGLTPKGLQILSTSPTANDANKTDFSNTTYYIAPSGAMVFATGATYWTTALDAYRFEIDSSCPHPAVVPGMQLFMAKVMNELYADSRVV